MGVYASLKYPPCSRPPASTATPDAMKKMMRASVPNENYQYPGQSLARPVNSDAWAIGSLTPRGRFRIRRIVWGRMLARLERREGEVIRRALILIRND